MDVVYFLSPVWMAGQPDVVHRCPFDLLLKTIYRSKLKLLLFSVIFSGFGLPEYMLENIPKKIVVTQRKITKNRTILSFIYYHYSFASLEDNTIRMLKTGLPFEKKIQKCGAVKSPNEYLEKQVLRLL